MKTIYLFISVLVITLAALLFLTSCTYSITQVHTQGQASDVVDETATNTPSTTVKIPTRAL